MGEHPPPCQGRRKNGQPCRADARPGSMFCLTHDPSVSAEGRYRAYVAPTPEVVLTKLRQASDGLTMREYEALLSSHGKDRREEVIKLVRESPDTTVTHEVRPNSAGRPQRQVVIRWTPQ
jgi:hypothetical protein